MKAKDKKRLEWIGILGAAAAALGVGAYFVYEHETANPLVLAPGVIAGSVPAHGGSTTFTLPSGAKNWVTASTASTAAPVPASLAIPSSPTTGIKVPTPSGSTFAFTWVDSTGATQASSVTFA